MVTNINGHIFIVFAGEQYYKLDVPDVLDIYSSQVYKERNLVCKKYLANLYIWIAIKKYTDNVEIYSVREVDVRGHFHTIRNDLDFQYTKIDRYFYKMMLNNKEGFDAYKTANNINY